MTAAKQDGFEDREDTPEEARRRREYAELPAALRLPEFRGPGATTPKSWVPPPDYENTVSYRLGQIMLGRIKSYE